MAIGTAACMAGADPDKVAQLPDPTGMPNTVLIQAGHHYHYEHVVTVPGAKLREVDGTEAGLQAALGPHVANVLFPAHLDGAPNTVRFERVIEIAHAHNVPVLVDAAGRIFPLELFRRYAQSGADLVAFGAKYIGALNGSGILCGRRDLVSAAAMHGFIGYETMAWEKSFGRPLKLDRQTIVAVVAALEEWLEMDHDARLRGYERRLEAMRSELDGAPGVSLEILSGDGPAPRTLRIALGPGARYDAQGLANALMSDTPAIAVGRAGDNAVLINPVTLREEDDATVASRLGRLLL
jgi:L-seryl-tRNA(Ser) seleniumtransferase